MTRVKNLGVKHGAKSRRLQRRKVSFRPSVCHGTKFQTASTKALAVFVFLGTEGFVNQHGKRFREVSKSGDERI